jgi:hypothetical protein
MTPSNRDDRSYDSYASKKESPLSQRERARVRGISTAVYFASLDLLLAPVQ